MKFFRIPFQSGGDDIDPRNNRLQQYIQSQSVNDMARLAAEISPEVRQIIGSNVQALLGYLPNQDFNTTIMANKESLQNLLASAMLTGYFMHAMEARMGMEELFDDGELQSPLPHLQSPEELFEALRELEADDTSPGLHELEADDLPEATLPTDLTPEGQFLAADDLQPKLENISNRLSEKLNIQLEINTRMDRQELTELLRQLQRFQHDGPDSDPLEER